MKKQTDTEKQAIKMEEETKKREILSLPFVKEAKDETMYWCVKISGDLEKDLNKGWKYGKLALRLLARGHDKSLLVFILLDMQKNTKKSMIEFGFLEQIAYAAKTSAKLFLDTKFVKTGRLPRKRKEPTKKSDNDSYHKTMKKYGARPTDALLADARKVLESGDEDLRNGLALNIYSFMKTVKLLLAHERRKLEAA